MILIQRCNKERIIRGGLSMERSIINEINKTVGKINPIYDMEARDFEEIKKHSKNTYDLIYNSFRFGYSQGMKAAKEI